MPKMLGPYPAWDEAEKLVHQQLELQLPPDWIVITNVLWTLPKDNGSVRDGQADFVVLIPGMGMVVLEVKATREFWIEEDGCWYRRGRAGEAVFLEKSPPEQATKNMHELADVVEQKGTWAVFPGSYAYVVVYPKGEASRIPTMFDESTLVTSKHMHDLPRRLRHALERRGLARNRDAFTPSVAEQVAQLLTSRPFAVTKADTQQELHDDVAKVEELTAQQYAALRGLFDIPRVAIVGPAGAGKTLLAIWRLRALVAEGRRALFVCFNTDLAALLRRRNPDCAASIASVDKLFRSLAPRAAVPSDQAAKTRFFREVLPSLVLDAISAMPSNAKYDAILVDEGQDFSEEQLIALHELLGDRDSQWVFFADWRQDLFRAGNGAALGADVVFRLHHNCRNTLLVNDATNAYLRQHIDSMPGMPQGAAPVVTLCKNREGMAKLAWELAKQWAGDDGVVILSPYRLENSAMAASRKGHGMVLTEELEDFGRPGTVYFSTIRSFKGLEAAGVILVDAGMPAEGSALTEEDFYVACTRSTARLAVLTASNEVLKWLSPVGEQSALAPS